jgi:hypothetical protein
LLRLKQHATFDDAEKIQKQNQKFTVTKLTARVPEDLKGKPHSGQSNW